MRHELESSGIAIFQVKTEYWSSGRLSHHVLVKVTVYGHTEHPRERGQICGQIRVHVLVYAPPFHPLPPHFIWRRFACMFERVCRCLHVLSSVDVTHRELCLTLASPLGPVMGECGTGVHGGPG